MRKNLLYSISTLLCLATPNLKAQSITTTIGSVSGCVGDTVSVPVMANMSTGTSVSAISMAISFDSTKLQCLGGAQNLHSTLQIGALSNCVAVPGVGRQIRFVWYDLNPITINSQIFQLKFRVLSAGSHNLTWDLTPGLCEYATQFGQPISNVSWINGSVTCTSNPINVSLGSANGCGGDTLSMPVTILNGNNIGAISLALDYNPMHTTFLGIAGINPVISTIIASSNTIGGRNQIRASWAEVTPVSLNGIAFYIRVIANNSDSFSFDLINPGNNEISDPLGNPYSSTTYSGNSTTITPTTSNVTTVLVCSSYTWSVNNQTYTTSGTYRVKTGCHTEILNLTVSTQPPATAATSISASICQGQSYTFGSQTLTTSGTYTNTVPGANGCDSVVTLNLTVRPNSATLITDSICTNQPYIFANQTITSPGTYSQTLPSANGCDSVITLTLLARTSCSISTTIGSGSGCVGDTVLVPVTVQNGFGIASISMAIGYDPSKLACISNVTNVNPAIASSLLTNCGVFNGISQFRAAWFDLNPVDLNGNLFTMKFVVLAPGAHNLNWDLATPGNCEYTDAVADIIPGTSWNNGSVNLGSGCCSVFASITPAGSTAICQGNSITLHANTGNGLAYQWSLNGSAINGATNSSLVANTAGFYTVSVSESANCSYTSAAVSITVNTLPTATVTAGGPTTFCQGASVTLNANIGAGLSYQWLLNNAAIAGATNASLVADAQGSYTVTVTNANGCSATSSALSVTVRSLPVATITGASSICQGGNTILSANTGTGRTYQWRRNNINIIGATSANYTVVTTGTYTVAVTSNTCVAVSNAITVSVNPLPTVSIAAAGNTSICQGSSVTLNATTDIANAIQWRRNGTDIAGATNSTYTTSEAGSYTVRVTSPSACLATSSAVHVIVRPNFIDTVYASICQGQTYTFGSQTLSTAGTYTNTVTATNGCDSVIILILTVTLPPPPPSLACYQTANFDTVTCTWIVTGTPNPLIVFSISVCDTTYNWSISGQSYYTSGTYLFNANCQDYELRLVLNTPAIITSQPVNQNINQYGSASFTISTFTPNGLTNTNNYVWQRSINNGPFLNIVNNALFSGANTDSLVIYAATTALHQNRFRCIVSSNCGAPDISSMATLSVIPANPVSLSIGNYNICPNTTSANVTIPVIANAFTNVASMTFDLIPSLGITFNGISNVNSSLIGLNSNLVNGKIRVSWFSLNNINLNGGAVLFNINVTTSGPATIEWDNNFSFFFDEYNGLRIRNLINGSINTYQAVVPTIAPVNGICENGSPISLIATPIGGVFSGVGVSNGLFDPSITGSGYHNITYTYTTNEGCSYTASTTVYVSTLPTGSAGPDVNICPGYSTVLAATGGDSYVWSNGSTSAVNPVSPNITTTYTVNIFNASGCYITDTVVVIVSGGSAIQVNAGDSAFICTGGNITLTTSGTSQAIWYPLTGLSSTSSTNPIASPSVTTTYYVVGINNSGCVSFDSIVVVVNPNPTISFSLPNNTVCINGTSIGLTGTPSGGTFSGRGISSGSLPEFVPSIAGVGSHIITYNYADPISGCSSSTSQTIEVLPTPTASAGPDQTICEGQSAILTATGGISYLWNNGFTSATILVNPTSSTVYSVLVTSANGCISRDEITVFVNPLPSIEFTGDTTICIGGNTQINVSGVNSVIWSPSSGISNPSSLSPTFNPTNTTTYTAFGTDLNGCANNKTVTIVVRPAANVSAGLDIISCGSPVNLTATGDAGTTFTWNNGLSGSTISVNPTSTTNYIVTATDSNGCIGRDTITVHVPVLFTGGNRNICLGASSQLAANLANFPGNPRSLIYQWSPSVGLNDPNAANPIASPTQTTVYNVSITDTNSNCIFTGIVVVLVLPTPNVNLGADLIIAPGVTINLAASVSNIATGISYTWSLIGSAIGVLNPIGNTAGATFTGNIATTSQIQRILLVASNLNGCVGSDTIEITVDPILAGKNITGSVLYANSAQNRVNSGLVKLVGPSGHIRNATISPGGNYLFTGVLDSTYTLQTSITKAWGGITIADAQLINDHVTTPHLNGIYLKAADVNGDIFILSNDAQQTARRAANLTITNSFDQNGPGNWVNDSQVVTISGNHINQSLNVLSYGDVNASYSPVMRTGTTLTINPKGLIPMDNEILAIPIYSETAQEFGSIQFEFEVPPGYQFTGVTSTIAPNWMINQFGNRGIAVWYKNGANGIKVLESEPLMTLKFKKNQEEIFPNGFLISPSGYQEFNDVNAVAIPNVRLNSPTITSTIVDLLEIYPNPSVDRTTISINLAEAKHIQVTLNDINGRLVSTLLSPTELPKGNKLIDFYTRNLPEGTYLIKFISSADPNFNAIKRLVVVH